MYIIGGPFMANNLNGGLLASSIFDGKGKRVKDFLKLVIVFMIVLIVLVLALG